MSEINRILPSAPDLHAHLAFEHLGQPDLPEAALYKSTGQLVIAAYHFSKNPEDPEVQDSLTGAQEALRGNFNLFIGSIVTDKLFDRSVLPSIIGTAYRHNLEDRRYAFQRMFPEAEFPEIQDTKSEMVRDISLDFLGINSRGLTDMPSKVIASKIARKFYLDISEDIQTAFRAKNLHHQDPEEPSANDLEDIEESGHMQQEAEIEDITNWMSEQDYVASMAAMYRSGEGNLEQTL